MNTRTYKRVTFTVHEPGLSVEPRLRALAYRIDVRYLVFGRERSPITNIPLIQGYIIFRGCAALDDVKRDLGPNAYVTQALPSAFANMEFATKGGDYEEFGDLPGSGGVKIRDWESYKAWLHWLERVPTRKELITKWPTLYRHYPKVCNELALRAFAHSSVTVATVQSLLSDE